MSSKRRDPATGRFVKQLDSGMKASDGLTAAASVIPTRAIERMPRAAEAWQLRAWRLWRLLGVVHFPTSFKAKQVGRLDWNVEINGEFLDPEKATEAIKAITGPLGIGEAARRLALNLEVAGQVFYVRAGDEWKVYAATTPKLKELLQAADIVVEGLQPDPEEPTRPTSSIQAALGTAEQIRLMAQLSRGQDRNRLSQRGILLVPKEGQFPEGDDFQANLEEVMTAPIADEYDPASVVPLKVEFPAEYIEKWRHLVLESPYDDKLMERMDRTITQFAREIDMPPEVLLGNIDSNHWNAWLSDENNYRGHVEPLGTLVGQVFALALQEAAGERFAGAVIVVTPDPAKLLARRSSVEDAFKALDVGAVGYDFVRAAIGADDDDAPTDEEIERILLFKGLAPQPSLPEPEDREAPEMPDELPEPETNGQQPAIAAAVSDEEAELDELGRRLSDIDFRLLSVLEGMTAVTVGAARAVVENVSEVMVADAIAEETMRLGKAWNREVTQARKVLRSIGIDARGPEWDEAQAVSVSLLEMGVADYITSTLDKTESQMPALPTPLLRQVLAAAGGSGTATVASVTSNPTPTFADPQGFAVGVLPLKELKKQDVAIVQWRFRYGPLTREHPFRPHKGVDGQFMTSDGYTSEGWHPGDHKGCLCQSDPVLRSVKAAAKEGVA